jgi:hypothetical protein
MKLGIAMTALALSMAGCGVRTADKQIQATVDEDGNLDQVIMPSGAVTNGPEEFEAAVASEVPTLEEMGQISFDVESSSENLSLADGVNIGKFNIRLALDSGYLAACIRHTFLHLKVVVTNSKMGEMPLAELHLVAWFESGAPCFAVMNTSYIGYGWCQKYCFKDAKKGVAGAIAGGLAAAGLSATVAKVSSYLVAPVAVAAFAL